MKKLLALLMAVAMLLTLCACGDKKGKDDKDGGNDPEAVAEEFVKAMETTDYEALFDLYCYDWEEEIKDESLENYDDEDEFFEYLSEMFDAEVESWDDAFAAVTDQSKEYLEEQYGEDYKIKAKADDSEEMDEDDLEDLIDELADDHEDYIGEDALDEVEEGMIVTVICTITGEDDENEDTYDVYLIKIDGKWKVADYEYIYDDEGEYDDEYYDDEYYDDEYYEDDYYEDDYYDDYYSEPTGYYDGY